MSPQQGQLFKGLPHCTPLELGLELELFDTVRHACCGLYVHVTSLHAVSLEECLCGKCAHTTHSPTLQWLFISPSDLFMVLCVT